MAEVRGRPHILEACGQYLGLLDERRGTRLAAAAAMATDTSANTSAPLDASSREDDDGCSGGGGELSVVFVEQVPAMNSASACVDLAQAGSHGEFSEVTRTGGGVNRKRIRG